MVKVAEEGVVAPIGVLLIVPPEIVRLSAIYASAIAVPCQVPEVIVPEETVKPFKVPEAKILPLT